MAWQNLGEELEELCGDRRPDLGVYTGEIAERVMFKPRHCDCAIRRLQRKLLAAKRASYGIADRNRTYTVRSSQYAKPKRTA